jgi:hypothetical protein
MTFTYGYQNFGTRVDLQGLNEREVELMGKAFKTLGDSLMNQLMYGKKEWHDKHVLHEEIGELLEIMRKLDMISDTLHAGNVRDGESRRELAHGHHVCTDNCDATDAGDADALAIDKALDTDNQL